MSDERAPALKDYLAAGFAGFTASASPVFAKSLYPPLEPYHGVFLFGFFGSLFLFLYFVATKRVGAVYKMVKPRMVPLAIAGILCQAIPLQFINYGISGTPSVIAIMMKRIQPILLILLMLIFQGIKPKPRELGAALVAVFGIYLLVNRTGFQFQVENFLNLHFAAILFAVLCWAVFFLKARHMTKGVDADVSAFMILFWIAVVGLIPAFYHGPEFLTRLDSRHWGIVIFSAGVCYSIGLPAVFHGLKTFSPVFMSLIMLMGPVLATIMSVTVFGESIGMYQIMGMALIIGSLAFHTLSKPLHRGESEKK
jgi:drug/metabolite transporter (DMT)-like permease